jgi:hypothetical protein
MTTPAADQTLLRVADRLGQQRAGVRAPGPVGVGAQLGWEARKECCATFGCVEIAREREDRRIAEGGIAVRVAAGCVHEERAANRRVPFGRRQRDAERSAVRGDDELDVVSRPGTRLRSSRP